MVFNSFLDPVLSPLLNSLGAFGFVVLISFFVSIVTILVYKYTTDQVLMKNLKEELDKLNKDMRKYMNDKSKTAELHKQLWQKQGIMFRHSMTSTLITFLPIVILFSWLTAHLAFIPLTDGEQFTTTLTFSDYVGNVSLNVPNGMTVVDSSTKEVMNNVQWRLSGKTGDYLLEWKVRDKSYTKEVSIGKNVYTSPVTVVNDGIVKTITVNYTPRKILNLLGWKIGWLGSYIIFALIFSLGLRKLLKVY